MLRTTEYGLQRTRSLAQLFKICHEQEAHTASAQHFRALMPITEQVNLISNFGLKLIGKCQILNNSLVTDNIPVYFCIFFRDYIS